MKDAEIFCHAGRFRVLALKLIGWFLFFVMFCGNPFNGEFPGRAATWRVGQSARVHPGGRRVNPPRAQLPTDV
jgi:hypothetical protein